MTDTPAPTVPDDQPLGITRTYAGTFDQAIASIGAALKEQGFGILSDIDVAATLSARLGVSMEPYRILGACNPALAHRALGADRAIGLLLPCNVVVREVAPGEIEVGVVNPETLFGAAPAAARDRLTGLAAEARSRLEAALAAMA